MSDIFQEVDEALKQEKLAKIWQDYQKPIIAGICALILGTAAFTGMTNWNYSRNAAETKDLLIAMDNPAPEAPLKSFITDTRDNHAAIAQLNLARLMIEDNKTAEAANIYNNLADDRSIHRDLRDLARVLFVRNSDKEDRAILTPVLQNDKSPWIWHARIEAALIEAHHGDLKKAITLLNKFNVENTIPASLKQRAKSLKSVYEYRLAAAPESAPDSVPASAQDTK